MQCEFINVHWVVGLYSGLSDLALQFLQDGVDDPSLNRELVELFPHRFDLCAEFKRLFVYDCSLSPAQIAAIGDGSGLTRLMQAAIQPYEPDGRLLVTSADELP